MGVPVFWWRWLERLLCVWVLLWVLGKFGGGCAEGSDSAAGGECFGLLAKSPQAGCTDVLAGHRYVCNVMEVNELQCTFGIDFYDSFMQINDLRSVGRDSGDGFDRGGEDFTCRPAVLVFKNYRHPWPSASYDHRLASVKSPPSICATRFVAIMQRQWPCSLMVAQPPQAHELAAVQHVRPEPQT